MAYKNIEINVANSINQQATQTDHFYKGFSTVSNPNKNSSLYDYKLITQDLINQFNTRKGERVMNPNFGSAIWDLLMEPLTEDTRAALTDDIVGICSSDPRIITKQIDLTEYNQGYQLELTLQFAGTDQSANIKLNFNQEVGLTVTKNSVGVVNYTPG
jgi:phage baseplate assembly protein W